ncbi:MAG: hypothetical protein Aurels2KO_50880 [Aureliella sp.]
MNTMHVVATASHELLRIDHSPLQYERMQTKPAWPRRMSVSHDNESLTTYRTYNMSFLITFMS